MVLAAVIIDRPVCVAYEPAEQAMHPVEEFVPRAVVNEPESQLIQVVATAAPSAVEYLPAPQSAHVAAVAPTVVEYLPAPQFTHTVAVVLVTYFPAGQLVAAETLGMSKSTTVATVKKCMVGYSTVAAFYTSAPPQKRQGDAA